MNKLTVPEFEYDELCLIQAAVDQVAESDDEAGWEALADKVRGLRVSMELLQAAEANYVDGF